MKLFITLSAIALMGHAAAAAEPSSSSAKRGRNEFVGATLPHATQQRTASTTSASSLNNLATKASSEKELLEATSAAFNRAMNDHKSNNFSDARAGYNATLVDTNATAVIKAGVRFLLATMDYFGEGEPVDYIAARAGFNGTLDDTNATAVMKATARYRLAYMDSYGHARPAADYTAARKGFKATLVDTNATAVIKADARCRLAYMDYHGQGRPAADYTAAREGFKATLVDTNAPAVIKATARCRLAQMDYHGQGLDMPNHDSLLNPGETAFKEEDAKKLRWIAGNLRISRFESLASAKAHFTNISTDQEKSTAEQLIAKLAFAELLYIESQKDQTYRAKKDTFSTLFLTLALTIELPLEGAEFALWRYRTIK